MTESIEERLQRSLDQAEDKRIERERIAREKAEAEMTAAEKKAADQREFADRFDSFSAILRKVKEGFNDRPDIAFRMIISEKPNPAPNLRATNVMFSQKSGPRSHSFIMHVNPVGVFQIHSAHNDLFSIGIMKLSKEDFQEKVFIFFDGFAQEE